MVAPGNKRFQEVGMGGDANDAICFGGVFLVLCIDPPDLNLEGWYDAWGKLVDVWPFQGACVLLGWVQRL
jgi:hypothetical protein